jgi:CheY-like chemotaxis protein
VLRDFIALHREDILAQTRLRLAKRRPPVSTPAEPTRELAMFLDQLSEDLRRTSAHEMVDHSELRETAGQHGNRLFDQGSTVAQVVHVYGDFCQVISGLAAEENALIPADELQTLGLCLDAAIAGALTEHARRHETAIRDEGAARLGAFALQIEDRLTDLVSEVEVAGVVGAKDGTNDAADQTLFVVDRDPHVRRLVRQFVGDAYSVECFDDGRAALEGARKSAPSALVTEILIPGLDGLALCRQLKGNPVTEGVQILVLSVVAANDRARQAGADAFLEKPLERERFVASLRSLSQPRAGRDARLRRQAR